MKMYTRSNYSFWISLWNWPNKLSQYKNFYEWILQCNLEKSQLSQIEFL